MPKIFKDSTKGVTSTLQDPSLVGRVRWAQQGGGTKTRMACVGEVHLLLTSHLRKKFDGYKSRRGMAQEGGLFRAYKWPR